MKLTKENQSSFALFLWFAFINSQLLLLLFALLYWRLNHMGAPLNQIRLWDPSAISEPLTLLFFVWAALAASLGLWLGNRFYAEVQAAAANPSSGKIPAAKLIISFVLLDTTGVIGLVAGIVKGNSCLAIPFIAVSAILLVRLFPSGSRFTDSVRRS